jgi:hypothetical protein
MPAFGTLIAKVDGGRQPRSAVLVLVAFSLAMLAGPSLAAAPGAATPRQLVENLARAAQQGDVDAFVADSSRASQRALAHAVSAQARLGKAWMDFQSALDERFGRGNRATLPSPDREAIFSQLVDLELLSLRHKTPEEALVRVRASIKTLRDGMKTEDVTLPAVKEGGQWKFVLTGLANSIAETAAARASSIDQATQQIREGMFKTRAAALVALAKANTIPAGGAAP